MNLIETITNFVDTKLRFKERKLQLKKQYISLGHTVLSKYVMPNLNSFVRHLIVEKGLDPDYVPPPPPEPPKYRQPLLSDDEINTRLSRFRNMAPYTEEWVRKSFKNLSQHPVLIARKQFEDKQSNPAPLQITIDEPSVVIGEDAINELRQAVFNIEKTVELPEPVKMAKPRKPRKTRKAKSKKLDPGKWVVAKSFNGQFRRVAEKK